MFNRIFEVTLVIAGAVIAFPQVSQAQCKACCEQNACNNCRPSHTRIIIWRSNIVSGGLSPVMGGAPPQGFAVTSVPAVVTSQPAIAIHPAAFANVGFPTANVSTADLADAVARRLSTNASTPASTSAASNNVCQDPCGSIMQLQSDVKRLTVAIDQIATKLEELDKRAPKLQQ